MKDLKDKVAFITGGASGLGFGMAKAFGREGMKVMIADIEQAALTRAVQELKDSQIRAEGVLCDVSSRGSMREAALKTIATFGKVHVVCNNAGVGAGGQMGEVPERDWQWCIDVNLHGVVHGTEIFAPLIESHGEGGHFVNTASMAGWMSAPGMEPYSASKFAVVAMSEGWALQLAPKNIGVSILCPGFVKTRIHESQRNRQAQYGTPAAPALPSERQAMAAMMVNNGIPVEPVANRVVEAIHDNDLYVFTHVEFRGLVEARMNMALAAFDKSAKSKALSVLSDRDVSSMLTQQNTK